MGEPTVRQVVADALGATAEVNGGELESVLTIYKPEGLAVLVLNALKRAGFKVVPADDCGRRDA